MLASAPRLEEMALPRSAARVLAACASSRRLCAGLSLDDALAEDVFDRLGGDFSSFDARELRATAFRTHVLDGLARHRLAEMPSALGVGMWPLLGTRSHRMDSERWVDVDAPEVARLRRFLLPHRSGWLQMASCLCNSAWMESVSGKDRRKLLLVLDESVLPLSADTMMRFLDGVALRISSGSELLIAFDAHAPLRPSLPLSRASALELWLHSPERVARYPRLRIVDPDEYPEDLRTRVSGVNAIAQLHHGIDAPALVHVRVL